VPRPDSSERRYDSAVQDVTDMDFDEVVLRSEAPVVVDFWAPWCGPCKAVAPVLEQLAETHPGVRFVKLDIDENPDAASRHGVLSIPTVILFEGGQARETLAGARPKSHYERAWAAWLGAPV
jgi:thioredoxin 1